MTDSKIVLAPPSVPAGPVAFKIVNRAKGARDFKIAGKRTSAIPAGKSATLNVKVTTGKTWVYYSAGKGGAATLDGVLLVVAPSCTTPVLDSHGVVTGGADEGVAVHGVRHG